MYQVTDWLPHVRVALLAMAFSWREYIVAAMRTAWGIPVEVWNVFNSQLDAAEALLKQRMDKAVVTPVIIAECRAAFRALELTMRDMKRRYFLMPPLTIADWVALGFKLPDTTPTEVGPPQNAPVVSLSYEGGPHVITVRMGPAPGGAEVNLKSEYGYAIYVGIMPPGGATLEEAASNKHYLMEPPVDGEGLQHYRFTRSSIEKLYFDAHEAGKTVYVVVRYENGKGEVGKQWSRMTSAVIPG